MTRQIIGLVFMTAVETMVATGQVAPSASGSSHLSPAGTLTFVVDELQTRSWFGRPFWKTLDVKVMPHPVSTGAGEVIPWTVSEVSNNGNTSLELVDNGTHFDKEGGAPVVRPYPVEVSFKINDDPRLRGQTLTATVQINVRYVDEERSDRFNNTLATKSIQKDITFALMTADEMKAQSGQQRTVIIFMAAAIILLCIISPLVARLFFKPTAFMRSLNDWRLAQIARLDDVTVGCPRCNERTEAGAPMARCTACNSVLLRPRVFTRAFTLLVPAFLAAGCYMIATNATMLYWMVKNVASMGVIGVVIIIVLFSMMRSAIAESTVGVTSALLLPSGTREMFARLANWISAQKSVTDRERAHAYALTLCQPFVRLTEYHISGLLSQKCN